MTEPMTSQDIFETMARHLLSQNEQSKNSSGDCRYRGDCGLMCAVGVLIADEHYSETMEGLYVSPNGGRYGLEGAERDQLDMALEASVGRPLTHAERSMMIQMQHIHDETDPTEWGHQMRMLVNQEGIFEDIPNLTVPAFLEEAA